MADVPENQNNEAPLIDPELLAANIPAAAAAAAVKKPAKAKTVDKGGYIWGTGRRKRSVARVRIKPGKGKIMINKKEHDKYFTQAKDIGAVLAPLKATETEKSLDVFVNVGGGGTTGLDSIS